MLPDSRQQSVKDIETKQVSDQQLASLAKCWWGKQKTGGEGHILGYSRTDRLLAGCDLPQSPQHTRTTYSMWVQHPV